jgi:hypothetical protein
LKNGVIWRKTAFKSEKNAYIRRSDYQEVGIRILDARFWMLDAQFWMLVFSALFVPHSASLSDCLGNQAIFIKLVSHF